MSQAYAWNAFGHQLIAQIAYDHMTLKAKRTCNRYIHALDHVYSKVNFVQAATWLDDMRSNGAPWFNKLHYIDLYFTADGTSLPPTPEYNAIYAVNEATAILQNSKISDFDKGLSLRILLHVIGDIHQPLHAVSNVSKSYPNSDLGGNLYRLGKNPVGSNLHIYWDMGGGLLIDNQRNTRRSIKKRSLAIAQKWPCMVDTMDINPHHWADESQWLAINVAYKIKSGMIPNKLYQQNAKEISEQRISQAGCRMAAIFNNISKKKCMDK